LLLIALMMGGNHVAARVAFDHGVDVFTFGLALVLVALLGLAGSGLQGGLHLPNAAAGWLGLRRR
jgi:phosphate/sulfate permease